MKVRVSSDQIGRKEMAGPLDNITAPHPGLQSKACAYMYQHAWITSQAVNKYSRVVLEV